jgi:serine/threonine protein kinase
MAMEYSQVEFAGNLLNHTTPRETAADATSEKRSRSKQPQYSTTVLTSSSSGTAIGKPILVSSNGNFPSLGSQLGPLFCLGRLGKGTFCSIHKCIQLHYYYSTQQQNNSNKDPNYYRLAAAKVELDTFQNSGVLDGEAVVLQHLDMSLPAGTVPKYMGYYKTATTSIMDVAKSQQQPSSSQQQQQHAHGNACSAIVMEYLQGEDMHQLRDRVVFGRPSRRIALADAVYLTAEVMLPLLQRMHEVGIVHRDVKPSNVVRCGNTGTDRRFYMVDFGLSKSLVVSHDSTLADLEHAWHGTSWIRPPPSGPGGSTTSTTNSQSSLLDQHAASNVQEMTCGVYCTSFAIWQVAASHGCPMLPIVIVMLARS